MKYNDFYKELMKQINLNAKFFKPDEVLLLFDFSATINEDDFEKELKE